MALLRPSVVGGWKKDFIHPWIPTLLPTQLRHKTRIYVRCNKIYIHKCEIGSVPGGYANKRPRVFIVLLFMHIPQITTALQNDHIIACGGLWQILFLFSQFVPPFILQFFISLGEKVGAFHYSISVFPDTLSL